MAHQYLNKARKDIGKFVSVTNKRYEAGKVPTATMEQIQTQLNAIKHALHKLKVLDKTLDRKD